MHPIGFRRQVSVVCKTLANAKHWHLLPPHHILHRKTNKHQYIDIIVKFEALKPPKYEYGGVAMSGRHSSRSRPSTPTAAAAPDQQHQRQTPRRQKGKKVTFEEEQAAESSARAAAKTKYKETVLR